MKYIYKLQWKYSKWSLCLLFIGVPISLGISFCGIYLPKTIVEQIVNNYSIYNIITTVIILGFVLLLLTLSNNAISILNFALLSKFKNAVLNLKAKKCLSTDYENIESAKFRLLMQRADEAMWGSNSGSTLEKMSINSVGLLTSILGYILFGTILSFVNPFLILLLTIMPIIHFFVIRKIENYQYTVKDETTALDKKMWYLANNAENFKAAKDIRIHGMNSWLLHMFKGFAKSRLEWDYRLSKKYVYSGILDAVIIFLRDGIAYFILINMVINHEITIDDFVLYFSTIGAFTGMVGNILEKVSSLNSISLIICDLRDFLEYPEKDNKEITDIDISNISSDIVLDRVYYSYPGANDPTIKNISCTINSGEKIAIVGLNGAGKTTLIKLISGLYTTSSGNVYIGGVDVKDYGKQLYKLFSVVFQDHNFMPISIAETVSCSSALTTNRERVIHCLDEAGLLEKVLSLPNGIDTLLNIQINNDGIELSGGEYQKLLLARALYKDAPILILDEPTASLDPIAERDLYLKYDSVFKNKTTIFISHRLSSTRFCDRIVFISNGEIAEVGTHLELLNNNKEYAKLYEIQSQYYTGK